MVESEWCDLTTPERALFQSMQIMYMTGKGNHLVTCLVPQDCVEAMNVLCHQSVRSEVGIATTNTFIFPNTEGSSHHVDGWYTTKTVLGKAGIDCSIINATNQRGRISTMYASLEVAEKDRAYFFKHVGHSEHVNVGTYQRPLPVLAMPKVGAVLANIDASMAVQKRTKPQEPQGNAANTTLFEKLCSLKVLKLVMTIAYKGTIQHYRQHLFKLYRNSYKLCTDCSAQFFIK